MTNATEFEISPEINATVPSENEVSASSEPILEKEIESTIGDSFNEDEISLDDTGDSTKEDENSRNETGGSSNEDDASQNETKED